MENDEFADQGEVLVGFWDWWFGCELHGYQAVVQTCDQ
jgi:hypothetical protein